MELENVRINLQNFLGWKMWKLGLCEKWTNVLDDCVTKPEVAWGYLKTAEV
jgi:hypothetical protein